MTRHRALAGFLVGAAIVAACTFPDVSFAPPSTTNGADAAAPPPAALPPDVDPDAGSVDATVLPEGGGHVAEGGCGANPCDCDGDQVNNKSAGCTPDGAADCDDFNRYINPDAGYVQSPWDDLSTWPFPGDWNCDKTVTKLFPYGVPCTQTSNCKEGFDGNPACGQSATYNFCKYDPGIAGVILPSCKVDHTETRTQGCK